MQNTISVVYQQNVYENFLIDNCIHVFSMFWPSAPAFPLLQFFPVPPLPLSPHMLSTLS